MKYLIVLALFGVAVAFPQQQPQQPEVTVLRSESDNKEDGTFNYAFELSDGTVVEQNGYIKNPNEPNEDERIQVIQGSYRYNSPEGNPIDIKYIADENGFQPQGDALPIAPPTPDHVLKTLEIIAANAAQQQRAKKHAIY